jgi:hypothetical protein
MEEQPIFERVPSGVPGLDAVLRGGFLRAGSYVLSGASGAGKTLLANQIAFHHAKRGGRVVVVTLLVEAVSRMLGNLRTLGLFDASLNPDPMFYLSGYRALRQDGLQGLLLLIQEVVRSRETTLLGSGKTSLLLHFLAEGARRDEPGLLFGFFEHPGRLREQAETTPRYAGESEVRE